MLALAPQVVHGQRDHARTSAQRTPHAGPVHRATIEKRDKVPGVYFPFLEDWELLDDLFRTAEIRLLEQMKLDLGPIRI